MIEINFPNPVVNNKDFYGREHELNRILEAFQESAPAPVVILGVHRIGKTSLLRVALQQLQLTSGGTLKPLEIEPRGVTSLDEFFKAVLNQMAAVLHQDGSPAAVSSLSFDSVEQFAAAAQMMIGPGFSGRFILVVDEFDELLRGFLKPGREGDQTDLSRIMGFINMLIDRKDTLPISMLITMTHPPAFLDDQIFSPLICKSVPIDLFPFPQREMEELLTGILDIPELPGEVSEWFYRKSGGNPYFVKLLLACLTDEGQNVGETIFIPESMARAYEMAIRDKRAALVLENIYSTHFSSDEKKISLLMALLGKSVKEEDLAECSPACLKAARGLVKRHFINFENGSFSFSIQFLGDWLKRWDLFDEELDHFEIRAIVNGSFQSILR